LILSEPLSVNRDQLSVNRGLSSTHVEKFWQERSKHREAFSPERRFVKRGYVNNAKIDCWYYPSIGEYSAELEKQNFRVVHAEHFDRITPLKSNQGIKDWFLMFGDYLFVDIPDTGKDDILDELQDKLKATHFMDGVWNADYKRIRIVAVKDKVFA